MMLSYRSPIQTRSWLTHLLVLASLLLLTACGGGGGGSGPPPEENVTITGIMDDGTDNSPIPDAVCRFLNAAGAEVHSDVTDATGAFRLVVTPDVQGHIVCHPRRTPSLALTTFSSTAGVGAGGSIRSENVTPATTVVADLLRQENPGDPEMRKAELLNDIVAGQDANLAIVVAMAERLYAAMYTQQINASFNGDRGRNGGDGGGSDSDVGGVSGDAGDGADFSPLAQATCEFVVGDRLTAGERVTSAALADFIADGLLNRPDLAVVADQVNAGSDPAAVRDAFSQVFSQGLGQPIATITDAQGRFELPVPPDMAGFIRCTPLDRRELILGSYFRGRRVDETITGQTVTPATTVFSTEIAPYLQDDLAIVQENFRDDKAGLVVRLNGPNLPDGPLIGISLGTETLPADNEVGLVAFAVTALFNAFNKNGWDADFPAAIAHLRQNAGVTAGFLESQGVPTDQSQNLADLVNAAINAAAATLGTDLATAWSSGRINVTVMNDVDGSLIPDAELAVTNTDLFCRNCDGQTDANGQLTLAIDGLGLAATDVEVAISGVPGFDRTLVSTQLVAFATVDLEVRLADPARDAQPPAVAITTPPGATFATNVSSLAIQGTAVDDTAVVQVTWTNDRGGSGTCDGTANWSASDIPLLVGSNRITVTARDAAGNESDAVVVVTYTLPDTTPPTVSISSPAPGTTTNDSALDIAGVASDDATVTQVTWSNDRGGSGVCTGTTNWSASGIPLQEGVNTITVTARDAAGNTATATLPVTYEPLFQLTIQGSGSGSGTVLDNALGINCSIDAGTTSGNCRSSFPDGTAVRLAVDPSGSDQLTAWSNPCSGTGDCTFTLTRNRTVTATIMRSCGEGEISVSPASTDLPEGGGTGAFDVNAPNDCVWNASTNDNWVTLTNSSGVGDGRVQYRVAANPGTTARSGFIGVNGHGHTINQTWSDFIGSWTATNPQENEIARVTIVDNANAGLRVSPTVWCDGGPFCDLPAQSVGDPGGGPISFSYDLGPGSSQTVTLTLQGPTAMQAVNLVRFSTGSGTIEQTFTSNLVPD